MTCPYCGTDQNEDENGLCRKCGRVIRSPEMRGAIPCVNHPNRRATTSCAQCGARLCDACAVNTGGLDFCRVCAGVGEPTEAERLRKLPVVDWRTAPRVGFGTRLAAGAVDWIILIAAAAIAAAVLRLAGGVMPLEPASFARAPAVCWGYWLVSAAGAAAYFILLTAGGGQTPGKQAMSIAVVQRDGTAPRLRSAGIAFAGSIVSLAVFGLGYLAILIDPERRAWHDRWAGTMVVSLEPPGA